MKKIILSLIILIGSFATVSAQAVYSSVDTIWMEGPNQADDNDFADLEKDFIFKNVNAASDSFRWVRTVNILPSAEWESAVCDINLCYPALTDSAEFEMAVGDSGIFYPHFYPGVGTGDAEMQIEIFNIHDRSQMVTIVVYVSVWDAYNSVSEFEKENNFVIYPNPVSSGNFKISGIENADVNIYSATGQNILNTKISSSNRTINTMDFKSGIYFVKINIGESSITRKLIIE